MKKVILNGVTYKTKSKLSLSLDTVSMLPYGFVSAGIIQQSEWAKSDVKIVDRFALELTEERVDGRKKEIKELPYFTWGILTSITK